MNKFRLVPEELIKVKAHKIWKKRQLEGREGTPESDWLEARRYLEKHCWEVFWWRLRKTLNKLGKLIVRGIRPL